ncbi:six-hairpin glycosidase-like protein [Serratia phage vB_SmaP-Kaonashi]|nr:six-hairpin glycosidase-like protein [Serratia phage vB_SmaP-Kaonashi]
MTLSNLILLVPFAVMFVAADYLFDYLEEKRS